MLPSFFVMLDRSGISQLVVREAPSHPLRQLAHTSPQKLRDGASLTTSLLYPTYSDGGTPNCFLKEVEKWERVLKPVM